MEPSKEPRDVVSEYAEYGSEVYAPLTRNGLITRDKMTHLYETRPAQLESLDGLLEMEVSLPKRLLEPTHVKRPGKGKPQNYHERRTWRMFEQLERTDAGLKAAKQARTSDKEQKDALLAAYRDTKPVDRPPTPQVVPTEHTEHVEVACVLLQRLLRGRAIQNMMYEGKERRLELIHELRVEDTPTKEDLLLQSEAEAEAGLSSVVDAVQAELVGNSLDRMSKEFRRYHEEQRIATIVREAERVRRIRESEESGRRQGEMRARAEIEAAYQLVMGVHRASANSFIDEICAVVVAHDAGVTAAQELAVKESRIDTLVDKVVERHSSIPATASELVHGFVLPEVQRQVGRRLSELEESKYSNASRRALFTAIDKVEARLAI